MHRKKGGFARKERGINRCAVEGEVVDQKQDRGGVGGSSESNLRVLYSHHRRGANVSPQTL